MKLRNQRFCRVSKLAPTLQQSQSSCCGSDISIGPTETRQRKTHTLKHNTRDSNGNRSFVFCMCLPLRLPWMVCSQPTRMGDQQSAARCIWHWQRCVWLKTTYAKINVFSSVNFEPSTHSFCSSYVVVSNCLRKIVSPLWIYGQCVEILGFRKWVPSKQPISIDTSRRLALSQLASQSLGAQCI